MFYVNHFQIRVLVIIIHKPPIDRGGKGILAMFSEIICQQIMPRGCVISANYASCQLLSISNYQSREIGLDRSAHRSFRTLELESTYVEGNPELTYV